MIGLLILVGEVVRVAGHKVRFGEGAAVTRVKPRPGFPTNRPGPIGTGASCAPLPPVNRALIGGPWRCETTARSAQSLNH
jgi:hypothetical protein